VSVILAHERFRALESAWRGLKFLVDQIDFRADVSLDVLAASDEDFAEAVHYQVLMPEHEGRSETPASLLVFDRALGCDADSMEALEEIAGVAESLQTPALAAVSHRFFGFDRPEEMGDMPVVWQHLQGPEYVAWNKFTESNAAALVSLALPPVLLREPHRELNDVPLDVRGEDGGLWGSASLAVASFAARRFAQSGWPTGLAGPGEHEIAERPLWTSDKGPIPLAAAYSSGKQGELADEGFTVLTCSVGSDRIRVHPAPTAARFRKYEDEETTRRAHALRNLDAQLFIARIVHFLVEERKRWSSESTAEEIRSDLERGLCSLLGVVDDPQAKAFAAVTISDGDVEGMATMDISVTSPPSILTEEVTFSARIAAGKAAE
jgi:type VI secretion system protein ImpC